MKHQSLFRTLITGIFVALLTTGNASANSSDTDEEAKAGIVACSGNFRTTSFNSRWIIHNLNQERSITLTRIRSYAASGTILYDSDVSGPAPSATVVPFGVMTPNQTISFRSEDLIAAGLLPGNLPRRERPIKTYFEWVSTSGKKVITPYVLLTRSGPGDARHARDCRSISYKKDND